MRYRRVGEREDDGQDAKPTLDSVMEHFEVDFNSERNTGMAHCPLHEDNTPSMSYKIDAGLWKCHSCGQGGDSYTMIMLKEETDFRGARAFAATLGLPEGDAGRGDAGVRRSAYGGGRTVASRKGNRQGGSSFRPTWRRR
ncbi:putative primase [Streptomyces phage phiHau3]|uniref:Putative primase n=1 Tax=Streptomyces phage phiHau3 TaxID=1204524 RepID=K4HZN1_9CAUD|nr:DNA primase [Streptomyces phage phiHau3]AFU62017.1 putative primase [Streptomyces phage phiHau3]